MKIPFKLFESYIANILDAINTFDKKKRKNILTDPFGAQHFYFENLRLVQIGLLRAAHELLIMRG